MLYRMPSAWNHPKAKATSYSSFNLTWLKHPVPLAAQGERYLTK
jgi:hypothetical protein